MDNSELHDAEIDRMKDYLRNNNEHIAQIRKEQHLDEVRTAELSHEEYESLKTKIYGRVYAAVWLISFICAIPFLRFIIAEDHTKVNAEELLKAKNPRGYEQYLVEKQADPEGRHVEQDDFITPWIWISFFLGSYAILYMLGIFFCFYELVNLFLALPPLIKWLIVFIFHTILYGCLFLGTCYLMEKIGRWVMGDKYREI